MVNVLLVTNSTTHAAATRSKAALESHGHTVTLAAESTRGSVSLTGVEVVATVRASRIVAPWLAARWAEGFPLLLGGPENGALDGGPGHQAADLGLISHARTFAPNNQLQTDRVMDLRANHPITQGIPTMSSDAAFGSVYVTQSGSNWSSAAVRPDNTDATVYGESPGDRREVATNSTYGWPYLTVTEVGTDIDAVAANAPGPTAPARAVFCGWLYAGQFDYTTEGKTILSQAVAWLVSSSSALALTATTQRRVGAFTLHPPSRDLALTATTQRRTGAFTLLQRDITISAAMSAPHWTAALVAPTRSSSVEPARWAAAIKES